MAFGRQDIIRAMFARAGLFALMTSALFIASCTNPLTRQYEYEEQVYLKVDGSATVVVDASLPALVLLRGASFDPSSESTDRAAVRRLYESAGCPVDSVSRLWERRGRRFAQIQVSVNDLKSLTSCSLLAWSAYALTSHPDDPQQLKYVQTLGPPAGRDPGAVNWDGSELVAFKVHVPSRIRFHNVRKLDGTVRDADRGNILTWEQTLADRRAGKPLTMVIEMEKTSILYTTLWLFGGAFVAAVMLLVMLIWLTIRRGRKQARLSAPRV